MEKTSTDKSRLKIVEEIFNSLTHGLGALAGIAGLVLGIVFSATSTLNKVAFIIYGSSLIILMLMSCLYHALSFTKAKKVFRVIDHGSIFILIAGSFTPFIIKLYNGWPQSLLLAAFWVIAAAGIALKATIFLPKNMKITGTLIYLVFGWLALFFAPKVNLLSGSVVWLVVAGGVLYTLGTIPYVIKKPFMHVSWHVFVVAAACFHFFAILNLA